jgi:hypothetical protein
VRRSVISWFVLAALYSSFRLWYDGGGGPLEPAEVAHYVSLVEERGTPPERVAKLREFLESDTGSDFVMANFIRYQDSPEAQADMDRYMAHMFPELFRRACHPVLAGPTVARALDVWGIENGERWSMVGLVRYRSRRDLVEIATHPAFGDAHRFKSAAMAQTIAVPVEPFLQLGSPRWLAAGALTGIGLLLELVLGTRRS